MGLDAGDRIEFIEMDDGTFTIMAATHSVKDLKGMIRKPAKPVSIEDMNAAIEAKGASAQ
jgi:bifunctional DNA-binding transcriptional regulator/antitoxin component of YhaV-PrlF toxin-antitoxin module